MFCPQAADFGNVADWVSGLGAMAAVLVALHIANNQARTAQKLRLIEANEAHARRALVITEAMRLTGQIEALAGGYSQLTTLGGGDSKSRKVELLDEIAGVRSQIEALQRFPVSDPRLFAEIGRIAHDCRSEPGLVDQSSSYGGQIMKQMAERMRARRDALTAISAL